MNDRLQKEFEWALGRALNHCKDPYAQAYLRAVPQAFKEYGMHGVQVQLLYARSNMSHWRGEEARKVKDIFKRVEKEIIKEGEEENV